MKTILLNPGPVTLSARVRDALLGPDLCHREVEFAALQSKIRQQLVAVYDADPALWAAVLLTGSGTAAVEAMLISMVPRTGHLLVLENGVYGERMTRIAANHGIAYSRLTHDWLAKIDVAKVTQALRDNPAITHIAVVHHETTCGRLNDLSVLADACAAHGVGMLLDGVSSFAAEEIPFEHAALTAVAATANKCLHGVPGTSFVVARRTALGADSPQRGVYLDLASYYINQERSGTPFTQSVQTFYALSAALDELASEGGWRARRTCYRQRLGRIRRGLRELGIEGLLPETDSSCVLHGFNLPTGMSYAELHDALKARGFVIYAGQSKLAEHIFRISMMGDITEADLTRLEAALREILA
jgi:2-aminoethylphosphonate-pyruvate transaminase